MLIVGVMELINLAHGSLFALGAYFAMVVISPDLAWLGSAGEGYQALPLAVRYGLAILVAPVLVAVVGMGLELCMRRTYGKKAEYGLLLTFGAAIVIEETIRLVWGPSEQYLQVPQAISGAFLFAGLIYSKYKLFAALFAVAAIIIVWLFLERTPYGAIIKAGAHDNEMVRALGINLTRLRLLVFGLGAGLAGFAGDRADAHLGAPAPRGRRCRHSRLSHHRARRHRQLLGRRPRRHPGGAGGGNYRGLRLGVVAVVDVSAPDCRLDGPGARPARQEERAGGVNDGSAYIHRNGRKPLVIP